MNKLNKKFIFSLVIILIAIVLLIFTKKDNTADEMLPTRDTEGLESYANTEEFCQDLTSAQEFDDNDREASFYETCMLQYR